NTTLTVAAPGLLSNDTDLDGNAVFATAANGTTAHGGTFTLNANGSFTYTPAVDYVGPDTFTYTATDGALTSNTATVTITVNFKSASGTGVVSTDPDSVTTQAVPIQTTITSSVA